MKNLFTAAVLLLAACSLCLADGTLTQTRVDRGAIVQDTFTWVCTSSNSMSKISTLEVRGEILRVVFNPATATPPLIAYTVTLKDQSGLDILAGQGTGLSTGTATSTKPAIKFTEGSITNIASCVVDELLTVGVSSCGTNVSGTIVVYWK